MGSRFRQPKARGRLCWLCDRRLYAGGRAYRLVELDGVLRPVHALCAERSGLQPCPLPPGQPAGSDVHVDEPGVPAQATDPSAFKLKL